MTTLRAFEPVIDAMPMHSFALKALQALEAFCLVGMVVVLLILATQLLYGCIRSFTFVSLVVCCGIAACGVLSFLTLEWNPGLIGTAVVVALHLMGSDPMRRASAC